jgi:sorbitol-specific phosphotransferase system component IIBC
MPTLKQMKETKEKIILYITDSEKQELVKRAEKNKCHRVVNGVKTANINSFIRKQLGLK